MGKVGPRHREMPELRIAFLSTPAVIERLARIARELSEPGGPRQGPLWVPGAARHRSARSALPGGWLPMAVLISTMPVLSMPIPVLAKTMPLRRTAVPVLSIPMPIPPMPMPVMTRTMLVMPGTALVMPITMPGASMPMPDSSMHRGVEVLHIASRVHGPLSFFVDVLVRTAVEDIGEPSS